MNTSKTKVTAVIAALALVFSLGIACCLAGCGESGPAASKTKNFLELYEKYGAESWCTIGSDGSYMRVDTNPGDKDSDTYYYLFDPSFSEAQAFIQQVNTDLGFTEALWVKMQETNALQGRQTDENEHYKVSWTYHPDKGLEVMYEVK